MKAFQEILDEATEASQKTGDLWMNNASVKYHVIDDCSGKVVGSLLDVCGNAWIRGIDKRSAFWKWYIKDVPKEDRRHESFVIRTSWFYRQEMGLHEEMMRTACKVLNANGIKCYVHSYID